MATEFNTLNNLLAALQNIATRHKQINSFGVGDEFEIGASQALIHPVLWVNPVAASMDKGDNGYTSYDVDFNVRVFDLVNKDESNENEVLSDAFEILKDVVTEFNTHPYYIESAFNIKDTLNFTPFTEKYDEEVSGWEVVMRLEAPNKSSFCGIPVEPITNYGSYTGGCSTTIINTSSDSTDVHITGFTYNNANALTIYDNTGGTFTAVVNVMTGLTVNGSVSATTYFGDGSQLSGISSANYFATGATLIGNNLVFDRNDSLSAFTADLSTLANPDYWTAGTGSDTIIANNGTGNIATGLYSFVTGFGNVTTSNLATAIGGQLCHASGVGSFIAGGNASSATTTLATAIGGTRNLVSGNRSTIIGGKDNTASKDESSVVGGSDNTAAGTHSVVVGGELNMTTLDNAVVLGGNNNTSSGIGSFIGGGKGNSTSGNWSSVIGGSTNVASGLRSVVIGGQNHSIVGERSVILGGQLITGTTDDTVFVPYLNIQSLNTGTSITNLGWDANGNVVSGNTADLSGYIPYVNSSLTGNTDRMMQVDSGGTVTAVTNVIQAYLISGTTTNNLEDVTNWDINGVYTGASITGTYQGQRHYDSNYFFEAVDDNNWIRLIRG